MDGWIDTLIHTQADKQRRLTVGIGSHSYGGQDVPQSAIYKWENHGESVV